MKEVVSTCCSSPLSHLKDAGETEALVIFSRSSFMKRKIGKMRSGVNLDSVEEVVEVKSINFFLKNRLDRT